MLIKTRRSWELPDSAATPESVFMNRRTLLKGLATGPLLAAGAAIPFAGGLGSALADEHEDPSAHLYPVEQNPAYTLDRPLTPEDMELAQQRFHEVHEQAHGHKAESEPVELVSVRLVSEGRVPQTRLSPFTATGAGVDGARTGERRIFFGRDLGFQDTPIYDRDRLEPGHELAGPAVVEQMDTTTVIHPEQQARVDDYKNLIITAKG